MKYNHLNSLKFLTIAIFSFIPSIANAYMGPGAGISAIGSVLAIAAAVIVAILGFLWYPLKRLLKNRKKQAANKENEK